ncbi:ribosome hibernation-promoting factor, HPF/YfiA family [Mucilaginibacter sp. KACC 22063]|uniref:ribosome hibernation-promoting factor, HPF/YfiA family n=1 Tax=Mucilaginibacter sp. KACC 22063 TaxID=3025666 RepID=UPI0023662464|nr:ribosome-associated translation inhibitor RaiA [Mucilaginibacter sp. KACC 22063]WDF54479.1 ribosome-associated translation inhibitor RaiA [Mucilaginibacter sp. KACC 22063]
MKITVQSIHFTADKKLLDFIQKKADKLDQFYDKIISGEVYLKLENVEDESNKVVEIKCIIPGSQLFVKEKCKSFEEATDLAVEGLRRQIEKHKQKKAAAAETAAKVVLTVTELEDEF